MAGSLLVLIPDTSAGGRIEARELFSFTLAMGAIAAAAAAAKTRGRTSMDATVGCHSMPFGRNKCSAALSGRWNQPSFDIDSCGGEFGFWWRRTKWWYKKVKLNLLVEIRKTMVQVLSGVLRCRARRRSCETRSFDPQGRHFCIRTDPCHQKYRSAWH